MDSSWGRDWFCSQLYVQPLRTGPAKEEVLHDYPLNELNRVTAIVCPFLDIFDQHSLVGDNLVAVLSWDGGAAFCAFFRSCIWLLLIL